MRNLPTMTAEQLVVIKIMDFKQISLFFTQAGSVQKYNESKSLTFFFK